MENLPANLVDKHTLGAMSVLLVLFCAFFWLGFYIGKKAASNNASATAVEQVPTQQNQPVRWRIAGD